MAEWLVAGIADGGLDIRTLAFLDAIIYNIRCNIITNMLYKNMSNRKPLVILSGEIKSPPFSIEARIEAGTLLGLLQEGGSPSMPHARPMPDIGTRCLELRVKDKTAEWRIFGSSDNFVDFNHRGH